MKTILVILFSQLALSAHSQDSLDAKISKEVCQCISFKTILSSEDMENCLFVSIEKNQKLLLEDCLGRYGDTTEETSYKCGRALWERLSVSMIFSCKSYRNLIDSLRFAELRLFNKDSIRQIIARLNKYDVKQRNDSFYSERGVSYFQVSELDSALADLNKAIQLNDQSYQSLFFKAWALEIKEEYDEAYIIFDRLSKELNKNDLSIYAAIVLQKKKGLW